MSYEQLEILVKALGVLVALVVTFVIKPYIDSKITVDEQEKLLRYIETGVRCAEQLFTPEEWQEKKAYVVNYVGEVLNNLVHIELTPIELDTLIEGIVHEVKKGWSL